MSAVVIDTELKEKIVKSFSSTDSRRKSAFDDFQRIGLPSNKSEEYRFTPITKALERNFDFEKQNSNPSISSIDQFLIPNLEANLIVFINGKYSSQFSKIISPASEVKISSLQVAIENGDAFEHFEKHLKTSA